MKRLIFFVVLLVLTLTVAVVLPAYYKSDLLDDAEKNLSDAALYMRIAKGAFAEKQPEVSQRAERLESRLTELLKAAGVCRQAIQDRDICVDDLLQKKDILYDEVADFIEMHHDELIRLLQKRNGPIEVDPEKIRFRALVV